MNGDHIISDFTFPLASSSWDEQEYTAIDRVVASGQFTMGAEVAAFESEFAAAMGARYAVMVNSGSSANLLIVAALTYHSGYTLRPGDEVLVPAVSWSTTYAPIHQYGLTMRFVDVDPDTLNVDVAKVEAAITDRTRAMFAVNLLGNPNDFAVLEPILDAHRIVLLEDNCESLGATLEGKQAGTIGLAGSFSCYFSHHISTIEGGIVATDDEELYHIMLCIRAHGWTRNLPCINRVTGSKSSDPFKESFRFVLPGYNLRPTELSGAIGRAQISKLPMIVNERRRNAKLFHEVMSSYPELQIQVETGRSSWFGFSIIIRSDVKVGRSELAAEFARTGIECRPIVAGNFARNEVVSRFMNHSVHDELVNADYMDQRGLFIGNHHFPLEAQMELLDGTLRKVFGRKDTWT